MTIRVKDNRGLHGRLYMAGKKYKVVNRHAEADDEVSSAHAAQLVEIGAAEKVTTRRPKPSRRKRKSTATVGPAQSEPASEPGTKARD